MKKTKVMLLYAIFSIILLIVLLYIYNTGRGYLNVRKSEYLGNKTYNIDRLKETEGKLPFSFAFISDTENSDISGWLIKTLLKEDIGFLVFAGDSVNEPTLQEHKFFMHRISSYNPKIPVFLVPSNHDIDINGVYSNPLGFSKDDFQETYGPVNYSFVYNNCLFIFLSNIDQQDNVSLDYLEKVLSERGEDVKYTFIFCSTPLRKILNKVFSVPYWVSEFDKLLERYKVDYVISGDYHRHFELTSNDIQYITSGSGGSHFHEKSLFGRFSNGTKITVYPDGVSKEILIYNKIRFTDNSIKHFIYCAVMPGLENRFWLLNIIVSIFTINSLFSIYCIIR